MDLIRKYYAAHVLNARLRALEETFDELLEKPFSLSLMFEIEEVVEELNNVRFELKAVRDSLSIRK